MTGVFIDNPTSVTFEVSEEHRTIRGLALPFGDVAESDGLKWSFSKGSLSWSKVKVLDGHDWKRAVGTAELEETDDGLVMVARIARGARGDEVLGLALDGVYDGLSVGLAQDIKTVVREGVHHAKSGTVREVSLTPLPSFERASITAVTASAVHEGKGPVMADDNTEIVAEAPVTFDAITDAIKAGFEGLAQTPAREVIPAGRIEAINEAVPYRFDGLPGAHDFSTDLFGFLKDKDSEAGERLFAFMGDALRAPRFDVDTGNVSALNPVRNRPDLYVNERRYSTPFYSALFKGTLTDITPFVVPKFGTASGLVAAHVEGVEPTPGAFTATSQTVTPSAVSGKVEITREVWDQGGSPQVSTMIWDKMRYEYFKALEAQVVAMLDAASPTGIALTAGASDAALADELEAKLAELNFIAGGNVFDFAGTHIDLYKALAAASDDSGRKLYPILGPANANGQARSGFRALDVAGTLFTPAWSLGATGSVVESSYLVDSQSVHVWNTPPKRLEFEYRVAYIDLAIWGYVASAITDLTGVREITYDPVA